MVVVGDLNYNVCIWINSWLMWAAALFTTTDNAETILDNQKHYVVDLLFYVHGKQLRSCRDGQLT